MYLDKFCYYARLRTEAKTVTEQLILSYLMSADYVLPSEEGKHRLPAQAIAHQAGCGNEAVYDAIRKLGKRDKLEVLDKATNKGLPLLKLLIPVPPQKEVGLYFTLEMPTDTGFRAVFPKRPAEEPRRDGNDRQNDRYEKEWEKACDEFERAALFLKRDYAISKLTGSELIAYRAIKATCIDIPAAKKGKVKAHGYNKQEQPQDGQQEKKKDGKQKAEPERQEEKVYGRFFGAAALAQWMPGSEKTLRRVLNTLEEKKLVWKKINPVVSNEAHKVYTYTPTPATEFLLSPMPPRRIETESDLKEVVYDLCIRFRERSGQEYLIPEIDYTYEEMRKTARKITSNEALLQRLDELLARQRAWEQELERRKAMLPKLKAAPVHFLSDSVRNVYKDVLAKWATASIDDWRCWVVRRYEWMMTMQQASDCPLAEQERKEYLELSARLPQGKLCDEEYDRHDALYVKAKAWGTPEGSQEACTPKGLVELLKSLEKQFKELAALAKNS